MLSQRTVKLHNVAMRGLMNRFMPITEIVPDEKLQEELGQKVEHLFATAPRIAMQQTEITSPTVKFTGSLEMTNIKGTQRKITASLHVDLLEVGVLDTDVAIEEVKTIFGNYASSNRCVDEKFIHDMYGDLECCALCNGGTHDVLCHTVENDTGDELIFAIDSRNRTFYGKNEVDV